MRAVVLGSGAGGGVPQWNCACRGCVAARMGAIPSRTQDSLIVSKYGVRWVLVNASPDLRTQMALTPELHPRGGREAPAQHVVLTNADVDHVLGLFVMRESSPLVLWCTDSVWRALEANALMRALRRSPDQLERRALIPGKRVMIEDMTVDVIPAPGKPPLWYDAEPSEEDNIALLFDGALAYASSAARAGTWLARAQEARVAFYDGTFFRSRELIDLKLGQKRAEDMAHWPVEESLEALAKLGQRRIFTHINNTNPMLLPDSEERSRVESAGIELAFDGMRIHA